MVRGSKRRQQRRLPLVLVGVVGAASLSLFAQTAIDNNAGADFAPKPPILAQTAEEEAKSFVLPPGYRMELVLSDPDIVNPAVISFDGDGRMYVAEMRTYMPDLDGDGQRAPENPISRWEDTNGDGKYDKKTVFADHLVLPRAVLTLDHDSILTNETDSDDVIKLTDTNNDGVADKREVFFSGVGIGRDGNLEHEQSGFVWGLDNWIYSTYNAFRFRWTPNGILREPTGNNGGQWGMSMDDDGKMWFVCAGCERGPVNFQIPIQYGAASRLDGEFEPGFEDVWPIAGVGDMQGGIGRVRMPVGTLNHFTATGGPDIYRGDRLPADLRGDLLFTEPVGRLIRRAKIVKKDGFTQLQNAYPGSEFILSSDPLFRPVNMTTGPDGTIYIADMYHGIIQEAQWAGPGSYLRRKIQQYQLEKVTGHGRIWRLRFDGVPEVPATPQGPAARPTPAVPAVPAMEPDFTKPNMLNETAAQLVTHLSSPNGWWRDTAQRLLVLKQDKSVVPTLQNVVRSSDNLLERFHALWTLEGLNALDAGLVREEMADSNPRMRIQAMRASETLYKAGDKSFADDYEAALHDSDVDVAMQAMLTLNVLKAPNAALAITWLMNNNQAKGVQEIGKILLQQESVAAFGRGGRGGRGFGRGGGLSPEEQDLMNRGETIYGELCYSCHGSDGHGAPLAGAPAGTTMAPPLAGSAHVQGHRDFVIRALLSGLTGPNNGKNYTEVMIPMGAQNDQWIASVASYVRNSFGNSASFVTPADVARVRAATANRKSPWTVAENLGSLPVLLGNTSAWTVTASHDSANAAKGLSLTGWNSGTAPAAGMWYQVELPQAVSLAEVQFNTPSNFRFGRGRGGRAGGAAPAGPPAPGQVQVQVSMDGSSWGAPVASGDATTDTALAFREPVRAKYVRITLTKPAEGASPWQIRNVKLYQAPAR